MLGGISSPDSIFLLLLSSKSPSQAATAGSLCFHFGFTIVSVQREPGPEIPSGTLQGKMHLGWDFNIPNAQSPPSFIVLKGSGELEVGTAFSGPRRQGWICGMEEGSRRVLC